jgi:hypothetical protein
MASAAVEDLTAPGPLCRKASFWIHDRSFQRYAAQQLPPQGYSRYGLSRSGAARLICDTVDVVDLRRLDFEPNVRERLAVLEIDYERWMGRLTGITNHAG